jgi:hypothetical protein
MTNIEPKESGWRERLEDLAAINYNLYLAGTVERADTGEEWTHEQALEEIKDFIAAEIATAIAATEARVLEGLKKKEEPPNAGYSAVEASMYAYAKGYNQCVEDVRALFSSKT